MKVHKPDIPLHPSVVAARPRLHWWRELVYVLAFYAIYSGVRNTQGSASVSAHHALRNARALIHLERLVRLFHEQRVQHWFIGSHNFIEFWNVYYGSAHFVVTAGAMVWLFRRMPERYPFWRNALAATTALALIGFALYPLMPPRLLPSSYGFVDTLQRVGGLWSFDSGTMQKISNQYAAMPSLHCAWATWCTLVLWPGMKKAWAKVLVVLYPLFTVFCIVVTANHYFLDAVGGLVTLSAGLGVSSVLSRYVLRREPPAPSLVSR